MLSPMAILEPCTCNALAENPRQDRSALSCLSAYLVTVFPPFGSDDLALPGASTTPLLKLLAT